MYRWPDTKAICQKVLKKHGRLAYNPAKIMYGILDRIAFLPALFLILWLTAIPVLIMIGMVVRGPRLIGRIARLVGPW
jgi:hypothetical protein